MLGVAGRGRVLKMQRNSKIYQYLIWFGTLGLFEGNARAASEVSSATEREIIEEEIRVLELIEVDNVPFYGIHPTNTSSVQGMLPRDKETMINRLKHYLATEDAEFLDSAMRRDTL